MYAGHTRGGRSVLVEEYARRGSFSKAVGTASAALRKGIGMMSPPSYTACSLSSMQSLHSRRPVSALVALRLDCFMLLHLSQATVMEAETDPFPECWWSVHSDNLKSK